MVIDHLVGHSYLHQITLGNFYVTAAEVFVVCAGLALGIRSKARWNAGGWRTVLPPILRRGAVLYFWSVALMIFIGGLNRLLPGSGRPIFDAPHASWGSLIGPSVTLQLAPPILDILPLYLGLLLLTPCLVVLLARGWWWQALVLSLVVWWFNWNEPYALSVPSADRGGRAYFPLASWQVLFVTGFVVAWCRGKFEQALRWTPRLGWVTSLSVITAALSWASVHDSTLWTWPIESAERLSWLAATDRSLLGPVRLIAVAAFLPLLLWVLQTLSRSFSGKWLTLCLLPLGQNALYAYIAHVPIVLLWTAVIAPHLGQRAWLASLGQMMGVATVWWFIQRRIGFRHLPL